MKLSEGMILGGTLAKHIHAAGDGDVEGCAIQLAGLASPEMAFQMDWIHQQKAVCPGDNCLGGKSESTVGGVIVCLNDYHKWPLDRIAEWVASVEPADLPAEPLAAAPAEQPMETVLETVPGPNLKL